MGAYNKQKQALEEYNKAAQDYTGTAGYRKSLQNAMEGANITNEAQVQQAQQAARNAGMSKGQAATMATNAATQGYAQNLSNQQNYSDKAGQAALNAASGKYDLYGKRVNSVWDAIGKSASTAGELIGAGAMLSDERCKEIWGVDDDKLQEMKNIHLYEYNYKPDVGEDSQKPHMGVMAQEVEKVIPTAVKENEDGHKEVDIKELVMSLTGIVGELARKLDEKEDK